MRAYKMFDKDLKCRGLQYKVGEWMQEPEANCVKNGFHCAENPLDCLSYYQWDFSRCFLVEAGGSIDEDGRDSKIACTRIRLLKELSLLEFVAAACNYMIDHPRMPINSRVKYCDAEVTQDNFVICRGTGLKAKGNVGDIIAILEEAEGEITGAALYKIDGKEYFPGKWYGIDGEVGG